MIERYWKILIFAFMFGLYSLSILCSPEEIPITIEAKYLAYSYDWDVLYAEDEITILFPDMKVSCEWLRIDFKYSELLASGNVITRYQDNEDSSEDQLTADLLALNLKSYKGKLLTFGQKIKQISWPLEDNDKETEIQPIDVRLLEITREKVEGSFLYYLAAKMEISPQMEINGYDVILFFEDIPSLHLSKKKLKSLNDLDRSGFRFKSIRFANNQGLLTGLGYRYKSSRFFANYTELQYQERALLKGEHDPERIARLSNQADFKFGEKDDAQLYSYYDSAAGWWSRFRYNHRYSSASLSSVELFHRETFNLRPESWIVINNMFQIGKGGSINALLKYELQRQYSTDLSYSQILPAGFSFNIYSSYNRRQPGSYLAESQIFNGNVNLNYANRYISLQSGYSMNRDLLADRTLTQPSLLIQTSPFTIYGDLLAFNISNSFYYSTLHISGMEEQKNYNNNLAFDFSNVPIYLFKDLTLTATMRLEQLMRRDGDHVTSGGLLLSLQRWISERSYWRLIYSYQTRRPTENWLIEGVNTQDLTAQVRVQPFSRILTWLSVSADPELGKMKSSNANVVYEIGRRWWTEMWASYDFQMGSLNHLDFILAKDLQRAELRFKWRHLTREFLFEFAPRF